MLGENVIPCQTIPKVMESVESDETTYGVVPIENSIEGSVGITLDSFAHDFDLKIYKEIVIPINQNLIVNKGVKLEDIEEVYSHPQAIAQCNKFIVENDLKPVYTRSTANAVETIIGNNTKSAIGNIKAAEIYCLDVIKTNIQETDNNETRFVIISKKEHEITGRDKTSIIFSIYEDAPGGLYDILGIFKNNNINLTKIESRPSKKGLGKYLFFVDFNGHKNNPVIGKIIEEIEKHTYFFKFLGSYPEF